MQKLGMLVNGSKRLNYRVQRFNDLCKLAVQLGQGGSLSPETYHIAFQALESVLKHCVDANNSTRSVLEANMAAHHGFDGVEELNPNSSIVKSSKKNKTYKKRKSQMEPDDSTIRLQDRRHQLFQIKSKAHNLSNCHIPQKELEREHGSRSRGDVSYFGAQQSIEGAGQLNSISPIRDGNYGNQHTTEGYLHLLPSRVGHYGIQLSTQGMVGLGQHCFRAPVGPSWFDIHGNLQDMVQERPVGSSRLHGSANCNLILAFVNCD